MKAIEFNVNVGRFIAAKSIGALLGDRAFYKGPLPTVRLAEVPEPVIPDSDWVKIKTLACGFCGSDLNLIRLHDSPSASPFTSFPCVIGHEIVGEIVEVGPDVKGFSRGDRVAVNPGLACQARGISPPCKSCAAGRPACCENYAKGRLPPGMFIGINSGLNGGFAPYLVAHQSQLFAVPESLSLESAVMTEPFSVALQTIFDNMPESRDKILVIGGGVIGNLVVQSARALVPDCHISVIEPARHAADLVLDCGADEIIAAKDAYGRAADITGATIYKPLIGPEIAMGGFDRAYDTVASSATLNLGMRLLSNMGILSIVGIGGDVKLDLTPLWLKLQTIKGVYGYGYVEFEGKTRHVFEIALDMMANGAVAAHRLVTHRFAIEDFEKMIEFNLDKSKYGAMKTIVCFD